jgi:hypothetical protein
VTAAACKGKLLSSGIASTCTLKPVCYCQVGQQSPEASVDSGAVLGKPLVKTISFNAPFFNREHHV